MSKDTVRIKEDLVNSPNFIEFLNDLLPNGEVEGSNFCVGNVQGDAGRSLKVKIHGDNKGIWSDFQSDIKGDIYTLIMAVCGIGFREAVNKAASFLGIKEKRFSFISTGTKKQYTIPTFQASAPDEVVTNYLNSRGINNDTIRDFRIGSTSFNFGTAGGPTIVFPFMDDYSSNTVNLIKYLLVDRPEGKRFLSSSGNSKPTLFGWQALDKNARELIITKGEIEAMSWHQLGYPAMSVPFGEGKGNANWIEHEYEKLAYFEKIIVHADNDEPGKMMVKDIGTKLGRHRCYSLLGGPIEDLKDLNDALITGVRKEQVDEWVKTAKSMDPEQLKQAQEFKDDVIDLFYSTDPKKIGLPFPIQSIGDSFRIRRGEMTIYTGMSGHGKSQLLLQLSNYLAEQGEKSLIASFEMPAAASIGRMIRQLTKSPLPTREDIEAKLEWMRDKILFYDYVGSANLTDTLEVMEYAVRKFGCTFIVIDSLMKMGLADEDLAAQKHFVDTIQNFARKYNVHIALVAHSKKKQNEDEASGKYDVRGSGTITDLVENVVTCFRNKAKEKDVRKMLMDPAFSQEAIDAYKTQNPDAIIAVLKQRNGHGEEPIANCYFDVGSQLFTDMNQTGVFIQ